MKEVDNTKCIVCGNGWGFIHCRVSYWVGNERREIGGSCSAKLEREGKDWKV